MIRELENNLDDWLAEELDNYRDDDYLVFDCPGTHRFLSFNVMFITAFCVVCIKKNPHISIE